MSNLTLSRVIPTLDSLYILLEPFVYQWTDEESGNTYRIVVPQGFITDLASVPRVFWAIGYLPSGLHQDAAILHDWAYMHQGDFPTGSFQKLVGVVWANVPTVWSRDECDRLFLRVMKERGTRERKRWLMYQAVHLFGGMAWRSRDPQREYWQKHFKPID